jgi:hypothetical protein
MTKRLGNPLQGVAGQYYERPETELYSRLDALLTIGKSCAQDTCRDPWGVLSPAGQVTSLADAMNSTYDGFFAGQPKVSYGSCKCTDLAYSSEEAANLAPCRQRRLYRSGRRFAECGAIWFMVKC